MAYHKWTETKTGAKCGKCGLIKKMVTKPSKKRGAPKGTKVTKAEFQVKGTKEWLHEQPKCSAGE